MYSHHPHYHYPPPPHQHPSLHHHYPPRPPPPPVTNSMPPPVTIPPSIQYSQQPALHSHHMASSNIPPPSPSQSSDNNDESNLHVTGPAPVSKVWRGKAWALKFVQQPVRARMCGFGDKDRRPISPPPCVRLMIMDPTTNQEIDYDKDAPELAHLILQVDLYSLDGLEEKNLVKHSATSPSISTAAIIAYPPTVTPYGIPAAQAPTPFNVQNIPAFAHQNYASENQAAPVPGPPHYSSGGGNGFGNGFTPSQHGRPQQSYYHDGGSNNGPYPNGFAANRPYGSVIMQDERGRPITNPLASPQASGMYTRNLIGSLCSSAFKLKDLDGKTGLWFVLQDLSVRTEGWFRLKANFVNISQAISAPIPSVERGSENESGAGNAPVLATTFSAPFKVFSAKKFPGVIESTALSRTFASQGIKIPIRKEGATKRRAGEGSDDEGQDYDE